MPSTYAHYRFAASVLPSLPGDIRRTIQRFRRLYDIGLHGPDVFFYYNPFVSNRILALGSKFHQQTGHAFFQRVVRTVRLEGNDASLAYLYGVLTHYCLDSACHPFIITHGVGMLTHSEIETEFDRFLLELDGKVPPCAQDLSPHIRLTPGECETAAKFYPPVTAQQFQDSVKGMAFYTRLLTAPEGSAKRAVLEKGIGITGREITGKLMGPKPNDRCSHLNSELLQLYDGAIDRFPVMLEQLQALLTYNAPLGEEFDLTFG